MKLSKALNLISSRLKKLESTPLTSASSEEDPLTIANRHFDWLSNLHDTIDTEVTEDDGDYYFEVLLESVPGAFKSIITKLMSEMNKELKGHKDYEGKFTTSFETTLQGRPTGKAYDGPVYQLYLMFY